jgi:hypothetical protein
MGGVCSRHGMIRNAYKNLVCRSERTIPVRRFKRIFENNIRLDLEERAVIAQSV